MFSSSRAYSVDVFDTLVYRLVYAPSDIFYLVGERDEVRSLLPNFANVRVIAEDEARKSAADRGEEEVTLDEIYDQLQKLTKCEKNDTELIKQVEIQTELSFIQITQFGKYFIERSKSDGFRFVITSDMYLPSWVIEAILDKCGIGGHEKLFLSSETGKTKHSGSAFQNVLNCFDNNPENIVHIGDNLYSDVDNARVRGFHTLHVIPRNQIFKKPGFEKLFPLLGASSPLIRAFCSQYIEESHPPRSVTTSHDLSDGEYWCAVGSCLVAPFITYIAKCVADMALTQGVTKVRFFPSSPSSLRTVFKSMYGDRLTDISGLNDKFDDSAQINQEWFGVLLSHNDERLWDVKDYCTSVTAQRSGASSLCGLDLPAYLNSLFTDFSLGLSSETVTIHTVRDLSNLFVRRFFDDGYGLDTLSSSDLPTNYNEVRIYQAARDVERSVHIAITKMIETIGIDNIDYLAERFMPAEFYNVLSRESGQICRRLRSTPPSPIKQSKQSQLQYFIHILTRLFKTRDY